MKLTGDQTRWIQGKEALKSLFRPEILKLLTKIDLANSEEEQEGKGNFLHSNYRVAALECHTGGCFLSIYRQ